MVRVSDGAARAASASAILRVSESLRRLPTRTATLRVAMGKSLFVVMAKVRRSSCPRTPSRSARPMNKAFTRESDADPADADDDELPAPALPAGAKNYLTPGGYRRLRAALMTLLDDERPKGGGRGA